MALGAIVQGELQSNHQFYVINCSLNYFMWQADDNCSLGRLGVCWPSLKGGPFSEAHEVVCLDNYFTSSRKNIHNLLNYKDFEFRTIEYYRDSQSK